MKNEIIFTPFYLSFLRLCKRNNISPTEAARKAGISSGAPTAWKKDGAVPRPEQQKKLCALFNVSENELLGYSEPKKEAPALGEGPSIFAKLTPENQARARSYLEFLLAEQQKDQT